INKHKHYYSLLDEQVSRMIELMYMDPERARIATPIAFEYMKALIEQEFPKMTMFLTRGESINALRWVEEIWKEGLRPLTRIKRIFSGTERPYNISRAEAKAYSKTGIVRGEEVIGPNGETLIAQARVGDNIIVKNPITGKPIAIPFSSVTRLPISKVVRKVEELEKKIELAMSSQPKWFGLTLYDDAVDGFRKAVVDLDDFIIIRGNDSLNRWLKSHLPPGLDTFRWTEDRQVLDTLAKIGKKGLVVDDNGLWKVFVASDDAIRYTSQYTSAGVFRPKDSVLNTVQDRVFNLSFDDAAASLLREAGATEEQLPYFLDMAREKFGNDLLKLIDPELRDILSSYPYKSYYFESTIDDIIASASAKNLRVEVLEDGSVRLLNAETNALLVDRADVATMEHILYGVGHRRNIKGILKEAFDKAGVDIPYLNDVAPGQIPSSTFYKFGIGGGGPPPKFQSTKLSSPTRVETLDRGWLRKVLDWATLSAPWMTAMENFAKVSERRGFGPVYTKLFKIADRAMELISEEIETVAQPFIKNRTFGQELRYLQDLAARVGHRRLHHVRNFIESLSKEEIEAGALGRQMSRDELIDAHTLVQLGTAEEIPRLAAVYDMAVRMTDPKRQEQTLNRIARLRLKRHLSPESLQALDQMEVMLKQGTPKTLDDVYRGLNYSPEEIATLEYIQKAMTMEPSEYNLFLVSRWAGAGKLKKGFKTGRAQYASENQMNNEELELANELRNLMFGTIRKYHGAEGERFLAGYWPTLRRWVDVGFHDNHPFTRHLLPDDFKGWLKTRLKSGELDVYEDDPVLLGYKIVRSSLMHKHYDPHIPDFKEILKSTRFRDKRVHDIMSEYMQEQIGIPHRTFRRLNEAVETLAKAFGFKAPKRFAERLVNATVGLAYGATIPFRAALLLRNYYQMFQMTPGRIGVSWFRRGLEEALTEAGFRESVKNGAISLGVTPVFASTEIQGPMRAARLFHLRMRRIFEKGFDWYRKADDVGRAT
ncbi:MAG: hypothetical protein NWE76_08525, partial [Candidatus Bathyarchaeota archaeon]|nr:hypothetical protein [Candidatus Bathyarchaeota archaeon]